MSGEMKTEDEESLRLGWGRAWVQATGPNTMIIILFLCLAIINGGMVLYHHWGIAELHIAMTRGLEKIQNAQDETTYIHTLTDDERRALCLEMPSSLKAKVRANGGSHSQKRC